MVSPLPLNVTPSSTPAKTGFGVHTSSSLRSSSSTPQGGSSGSPTNSSDAKSPSFTSPTATSPSTNLQSGAVALSASDISSPHELTAFVETLLDQLDSKFDAMSLQILDRMTQMSSRVDALEASLQDIINTDVGSGTLSVPQSPTPQMGFTGAGSALRNSGSGTS